MIIYLLKIQGYLVLKDTEIPETSSFKVEEETHRLGYGTHVAHFPHLKKILVTSAASVCKHPQIDEKQNPVFSSFFHFLSVPFVSLFSIGHISSGNSFKMSKKPQDMLLEIISQYICISKLHATYFKYTQ